MPLDARAIGAACGGRLQEADQLCGRELDRFRSALSTGAPITVSCTQQAPLFAEIADEFAAADRISFANIRETAGWSRDARDAGPKMAALLAAAAEPMPAISTVSFVSQGVALVYGCDEVAIEAARRLAPHLDITVLLTKPADVAPPRTTEFPVLKGTIAAAKGHLGAFELRIDDYALPSPSSRGALVFGPPRDGATSACDLVVDLSGGLPLFPAHEVRSGYLRADPRDPASVERAVMEASHLVGEFDKPRFIDFKAALCAHSRSRITGCTRCLDICPTGAIAPAGDHVAIDPFVCAGCGGCAASCPTGAASYALPRVDALVRRLRTLIQAYRAAGGRDPVVLFHDGDHGEPLIDALARFGDGLPANVLPVRVNEVTQIGPETLAALFAYGAAGARLLVRNRPKHDLAATLRVVDLANTVLAALGYGTAPVSIVATDDPDELRSLLDTAPLGRPSEKPASFLLAGEKRGVLELAFRELHRAAPEPVDVVPLAAGAPFGGLSFEVENCTLCLSCVGACPTAALSDNPERPMLAFDETLCVQCGLCAATCPEDVIALKPQLDFAAWGAGKRVVKEEEPFHCTVCAKPFGTRSAIERVIQKLSGSHWMFAGPEGEARIRVLTMCEDCRVEAAVNANLDPHEHDTRRPRTTDDYLAARTGPGTA
ncbi:4Fe-4S binding protein [Enterovirga aerilata]|uniref:4Fe-4S binding protein n=1 Tax=Enterovirga aerilata TaxID=2730920 RepID=A0A849IFS0_9HYPH|nr:4Fe-4S binding protein [Enterovirga sp. DB1703]NNM74807.1 4Fe-4S binding protein [Enterovirga sp. DB1703]